MIENISRGVVVRVLGGVFLGGAKIVAANFRKNK